MNVLDKFKLTDRAAVVTGGAQGLGKSMACALAGAGANIALAEINMDLAAETAKEIEKTYGVKAFAVECDVTSPDSAQAMVDTVCEKFGKLDILVNNAGICKHIAAEDVSPKDWLAVINVNLNGVFFCAQAAGKAMIKQGSGNIINISSMSGVIVNTPQQQASYNASKAGVIHLTKSLAAEWAQHNIRVNTIAPGYMKTAMTKPFFDGGGEWVERWMAFSPMERPGTPDELDGIVLYLASDASTFTTGGVFLVDGGYSVW